MADVTATAVIETPEPAPPSAGEAAGVEASTLAEFMGTLALPGVDRLDIDLDGFDLDVLAAAPLSRLRPGVVECRFREDDTVDGGPSWRDAGIYLREQGYAVYVSEWHPLSDGADGQDWRRVVPFDEQLDVRPAAWGTVFAFRDDPGWPRVRASFQRHLRRRIERPPARAAALSIDAIEAPGPPLPDAVVPTVLPPKRRPHRMLRLARRAGAHLWRRRRATIPIAVLLTTWTLAGFVPALAPVSWLLWGSAALTTVGLVAVYGGLRLLTMRGEVIRLRKARKAKHAQLSAAKRKVARLDRGLAEARNRNAELLQKVAQLETSIAERRTAKPKSRRGA